LVTDRQACQRLLEVFNASSAALTLNQPAAHF